MSTDTPKYKTRNNLYIGVYVDDALTDYVRGAMADNGGENSVGFLNYLFSVKKRFHNTGWSVSALLQLDGLRQLLYSSWKLFQRTPQQIAGDIGENTYASIVFNGFKFDLDHLVENIVRDATRNRYNMDILRQASKSRGVLQSDIEQLGYNLDETEIISKNESNKRISIGDLMDIVHRFLHMEINEDAEGHIVFREEPSERVSVEDLFQILYDWSDLVLSNDDRERIVQTYHSNPGLKSYHQSFLYQVITKSVDSPKDLDPVSISGLATEHVYHILGVAGQLEVKSASVLSKLFVNCHENDFQLVLDAIGKVEMGVEDLVLFLNVVESSERRIENERTNRLDQVLSSSIRWEALSVPFNVIHTLWYYGLVRCVMEIKKRGQGDMPQRWSTPFDFNAAHLVSVVDDLQEDEVAELFGMFRTSAYNDLKMQLFHAFDHPSTDRILSIILTYIERRYTPVNRSKVEVDMRSDVERTILTVLSLYIQRNVDVEDDKKEIFHAMLRSMIGFLRRDQAIVEKFYAEVYQLLRDLVDAIPTLIWTSVYAKPVLGIQHVHTTLCYAIRKSSILHIHDFVVNELGVQPKNIEKRFKKLEQ